MSFSGGHRSPHSAREAIADRYDRREQERRAQASMDRQAKRISPLQRVLFAWSAEYACPSCKHGIGINVYLDNAGEVIQIIPEDNCKACGAGKPFLYDTELGIKIHNWKTAGEFHGSRQ